MVHDTTKSEKQLAKLEAELHDIRKQIDTLDNQRKELIAKGRAILPKSQALRLTLHIGKQVKRRIRFADNGQLNDAEGILLEVRRSKCDVDFGELGVWTMPVANVIPADASQEWGAEY